MNLKRFKRLIDIITSFFITVGIVSLSGCTLDFGGSPIKHGEFNEHNFVDKGYVDTSFVDKRFVDANSNRIRDDIDTYIEKHYSDSLDHKHAAEQLARNYQHHLDIRTYNHTNVDNLLIETANATHCLFEVYKDDPNKPLLNASAVGYKLEHLTFNNRTRKLKAKLMNFAANGKAWSIPKRNTCKFTFETSNQPVKNAVSRNN